MASLAMILARFLEGSPESLTQSLGAPHFQLVLARTSHKYPCPWAAAEQRNGSVPHGNIMG